jgi:hypothetical protein
MENTTQQIADGIYGTHTDVAAPVYAPAPSDADRQALADSLYPPPKPPFRDPAPNAQVRAVREADGARELYEDAKAFGKQGGIARELVIALHPGAALPQIEQTTAELSSIALDVGLDGNDLSKIAAWSRAYQIEPPTEAAQQAHRRTAQRELRERFGDAGYDDAMSAARALISRDPRLLQLVTEAGLGNRPELLLRFAELGLAARAKGQIK